VENISFYGKESTVADVHWLQGSEIYPSGSIGWS